MSTRSFREQDRARVLALLGDRRALDSQGRRLHVAEATGSGIVGASVWFPISAEPKTGHLAVTTQAPADIGTVYELALSACDDALAEGYVIGTFEVRNSAFLAQLQRHFSIDAKPSAWSPATKLPKQWAVEVNLQDARQQLQQRLAAMRGSR